MMHVVVRCPGCGAEPPAKVFEACEACGNQLRCWCRLHSGELGWLDGLACVRCIEADMRPAPRPAVRVPADSAAPAPAPAPAAGGAPGAYVAANRAALAEPRGVGWMVVRLVITGSAGGLMGLSVGFAYVARGGGPIMDSLLAFGRGGVIVGLILGALSGVRSAAAAPPRAPPPLVRPPSPAPAPAVPGPPPMETSASQWPGGRSPREILRGPAPGGADGGFAHSPPAREGAAGVLSLALSGALYGMLAGWIVGVVFGIGGLAGILATMLGLGGLMVGLIRAAAMSRDDG
ncbi:MAG TPA: hypothetical protein VF006_23470 [Longimicrobium sp.]